MFCVNCGKPYEPAHKFCNHCGHLVPPVLGTEEEPVTEQPTVATAVPQVVEEAPTPLVVEPPPVPPPPVPPAGSAPYAQFVSFVVGGALLISVLVFDIAQAVVRGRWETAIADVVVVAGATLLVRNAYRVWRRVVAIELESDAMLKRRHRRVLRNSMIVSLLFFVTAAAVGAAVGKSRDEAIQLAADLERLNVVGSRISKARSGVEATVASHAGMYRAIAPDVDDLEATLRRLKTELGVYDSKFPAQHEQTAKSIASMETGLRRAALLRQQIDVVKRIEALDESAQVSAWRALMMPLLTEEDALDKSK